MLLYTVIPLTSFVKGFPLAVFHMVPAVCRVYVVKDSWSFHAFCFCARDSVGKYGMTRWVRLLVTAQLLAVSPNKCRI